MDYETIRTALSYIPANARESWVRVGCALKSGLGDAGFDLWDEWSRSDESYNAADAKAVWRSIVPNGTRSGGRPIGIATLIAEAKRYGFRSNGNNGSRHAPSIPRTGQPRTSAGREAERAAEGANRAKLVWDSATTLGKDHPYLARKAISPRESLREIAAERAAEMLGYHPKSDDTPLQGRLIAVPVFVDGKLSTLELIDESGRKSSLAGGRKAGGFWAAGSLSHSDAPETTILVGEGVATVISAHMATGGEAFAALSATNLRSVALQLRRRYRQSQIVILADYNKAGLVQPQAREAAIAAGGRIAIPRFPAGSTGTDFNDLHQALGIDAVRAQISAARPPEDERPTLNAAGGLRGIHLRDAELVIGNSYVLKGVLGAGGFALVYGEPGCGKSFLVCDMALHIAAGREWRGRRVRQGLVIYVAAEGPASIQNRAIAACQYHGLDRGLMPFVLCPEALNLRDETDALRIVEFVRECESMYEHATALIVIDTLARTFGGGDENSQADMAAFVAACDFLRVNTDAAVLVVHHAGKDRTKGARGSTVLIAAADTAIEVSDRVASVVKQRDGESGANYPFDLLVVELGRDSDGDVATSCVVTAAEAPTTQPARARLSSTERIAMDALHEVLGDTQSRRLASPEHRDHGAAEGQYVALVEAWRALAYSRGISDGEQDAKRKAFKRAMQSLQARRQIQVYEEVVWLA